VVDLAKLLKFFFNKLQYIANHMLSLLDHGLIEEAKTLLDEMSHLNDRGQEVRFT
jgi:Flp pilus assembly protein TadD